MGAMRSLSLVQASLWAGLVGPFAWASACKGPPVVAAPIECPDPCCGGNGVVDCEINQNVQCITDADICARREYGCSNGSEYQGLILPDLPLSCSDDGGLGDAVTIELPDAFDSLLQGGAGDGASSLDAVGGGAGASDGSDPEGAP